MSATGNSSLKWVFLLLSLSGSLSGCAEIQKIVSVLWNGPITVNTSVFNIIEMSSGEDVTCNIMGDKTTRCLGSGTNGNLGRFYGAPINAFKEVKQVATGRGFTCVISGENSALKCFGINDKGQLGNPGTQTASIDPLPVLDPENKNLPIVEARQVTAGDYHACAILKNGRAVCWGDNSFGQLGNADQAGVQAKTVMEDERAPKTFAGINNIVAGGNSTCVIAKDDSSLFCFGEKFGSTKKVNWLPEKIEISGGIVTLSQVKQVGLGNGFGCALSRSQVYCWGNNDVKQLGVPTDTAGTQKAVSVEVHYPIKSVLSKIDAIAVGDKHVCALHRDEGTIYCWGNNTFGQLGSSSTQGLPEQVAADANNYTLKGAKSIAAGKDRTCYISSKDELYCWGNGAHGLLGNDSVASQYPLRVLDSNTDSVGGSAVVSVGYDHACVIGTNQKLFCFGLNQNGQMGTRMIAGTVLIDGKKPLAAVSLIDTYDSHTCAIYGEKRGVICFGGGSGSVGSVDSSGLEEVTSSGKPYHDVTALAVGHAHVCLVNSDQQVECIDYGTQPVNHTMIQTENKTPLKDIWQLRSRGDWNCGLTREKGEIWCWGTWKKNQWPDAKQITFNGKPTSDFIQFSLNDDQICGVHGVSGLVYCTADTEMQQNANNLQALNDGDEKQMSGVFSLTGGKHHTCAIDDKGHLYCWGSNEFGQLGVTTKKNSATPILVSIKNEGRRRISRVSAGETHTCFTTESDLSIFCFGKGFFNDGISTAPVEYPQ